MPRIFLVKEGQLELIDKPVFTTGDAYLVVDEASQKIWIWLGKDCSVDEKGTAAVEARRIDDGEVFHGQAHIITLDQGDEPPEFVAQVNGLKILNKNIAKSMLKDVSTGEFAGQADHVNALYRVSSEEYGGINAMKFLQVPLERASLESEDCFVADLGVDVWVWQGKTCNVKEKVKSMQIAREFDADRTGNQRPRIFMEGEDDADFLGIFEGKLPSQDRATVDLKLEKIPVEGDKPEKVHVKPPAPITPEKEKPVIEDKPEKVHVKPPAPITPEKEKPVKEDIPEKVYVEAPAPITPVKEKTVSSPPMKGGLLIQRGGGRAKCPKCGNYKFNKIREVQDRANIIMDYPKVYGKKYICGECGSEFKKVSD